MLGWSWLGQSHCNYIITNSICYTSLLKYVFRLEENASRGRGSKFTNSLGSTKLTNSLGKQQHELSTRVWSGRAPWNRDKFVSQPASCKRSPELRHGSHLHEMFWTFFLNLVFFLKRWPLIAYLYAKWFFSDNLLDLRGHVIDHALNWKKYDHLSYKM